MVINENNEQTLIEAKNEYYRQLTNIIRPHLYEGLQSLYNNAVDENKYDNEHFYRFQISLRNIRQWNSNIIEDECIRIKDSANCDYLDELIIANFTAYAKILCFIRSNKRNQKINVSVPKFNKFIHNCYIESAKIIFTDPKLFNHKLNNDLKQVNIITILKHIDTGIESAIRILSPYKEILYETLQNTHIDEDNDEDDIESIDDINEVNDYNETPSEYANDITNEYIDNNETTSNNTNTLTILSCNIPVKTVAIS